jgi:multidrug efflux pump subunit AcrB
VIIGVSSTTPSFVALLVVAIAAALIAAGLVSVVVLPAFALLLRPWEDAGAPTRSGSVDLGIES